MSLSAMSAGSISRSPSFTPVNTEICSLWWVHHQERIMFRFLSPFWFHWIFSQVQFTLLWLHIANAHILCDCLLWALSGRGKERMYLSVVSKVILRLNTKTSWGPFFLLFILLVMVTSYIYHEVQLFKPICGFQFGRWSASFHMFHTRSKLF